VKKRVITCISFASFHCCFDLKLVENGKKRRRRKGRKRKGKRGKEGKKA
jgi:hypothetical protein